MRLLLPVLVCFTLLAATSCSSTRSESLNHLIGSDFMSMADSDYRSAAAALSAATKIDYPVLADKSAGRDAGPWQVLALGDGVVVISASRGALHVSHLNKQGKQVWGESITLGKYQVGKQMTLSEHAELAVTCLRVPVDMGGCQALVFALDSKRLLLIRAETSAGQFAGAAFARALPIYKYSKIKVEGSEGAESLAALMRLSSDAAKMERSVAAVRSQLEAFSSSTNVWVAEAAASVLILPNH